MITIKTGNIFDSNKDVLVNPINCVGVMGKGLALDFKNKYPNMFLKYKEACSQGKVIPGKLYYYIQDGKVKVLNFPTKNHWRNNSEISYIISGLDYFKKYYSKMKIESIAFPALGCGNGKLNWDTIGPLMYEKLKYIPIDIEIYAPFGTDPNKLTIEFLEGGINNEN